METLYLLSYRGMPAPHSLTSLRARYRRTKIHTQAGPKPIDWTIHGAGPRDGSGGLGQAVAGAKTRGPRSRTAMSGPSVWQVLGSNQRRRSRQIYSLRRTRAVFRQVSHMAGHHEVGAPVAHGVILSHRGELAEL